MDDTPGRVRNEPDVVTGQATGTTADDAAGDSGTVNERTREIRDEIQETRVEMAETIDAIQEKLKPRNIVASATDRVKNAATERVREMADTASQTAQQAMDYTRDAASDVTDRFRQNPFPLALIGIGAAWLIARQSSSRGSRYGMRRDQRDYGRQYGYEPARGEALYAGEGDDGVMARIRNNPIPATLAGVGLTWLAFSGSESRGWQYSSRWRDESREGQGLGESASEIASRTREYASDTTDSMRRMVRRRQNQLQHMVQDNPLLVGAGALMLGAAFGMAVPETDMEKELMGEARDNVVGRARELARDAASQVQDAASTVADAAAKVTGQSSR
jgi:ElaB/YqjD/DUF883 family membrane-anchored ribosome-binding protein